jgi:SlyX protein
MKAMSDLKTLGDRLNTLEARLTFQDDVIETLNKTVTEQWAKIDALTRQLAALGERLSEAETMARPANEPPPHY